MVSISAAAWARVISELEASIHADRVFRTTQPAGFKSQRHPKFEFISPKEAHEAELRRQNPDNRERPVVDRHRFPDSGRIGTEAALPKPVGQQDHLVAAWLFFIS